MDVHGSAFKHGLTEEQIQHSYRHAVLAADLEPDADPPKVLIIGPDDSGNLIEMIALELAADDLLIIHAMPLRSTFHKWLEQNNE